MPNHWDYCRSRYGRVNHIEHPDRGTYCGKDSTLMERVQYQDDAGKPLCIACDKLETKGGGEGE